MVAKHRLGPNRIGRVPCGDRALLASLPEPLWVSALRVTIPRAGLLARTT